MPKMKKTCKHVDCFVSAHCVNGSCPRALANEHRERDDDALMAYAGCENMPCRDCAYYNDNCDGCVFKGTDHCPEYEGGKK